jgi:hypothetical protein
MCRPCVDHGSHADAQPRGGCVTRARTVPRHRRWWWGWLGAQPVKVRVPVSLPFRFHNHSAALRPSSCIPHSAPPRAFRTPTCCGFLVSRAGFWLAKPIHARPFCFACFPVLDTSLADTVLFLVCSALPMHAQTLYACERLLFLSPNPSPHFPLPSLQRPRPQRQQLPGRHAEPCWLHLQLQVPGQLPRQRSPPHRVP